MKVKKKLRLLKYLCAVFLPAAIITVGIWLYLSSKDTVQNERYLVGAHYYLWYPDNFAQGFLRRELLPPQEPALGIYDSQDINVAEQHIAWCSRYGIDFLALDWWPERKKIDRAIKETFLRAKNIADIRFCIFYETASLGYDEKTGAIIFSETVQAKFMRDMRRLAKDFLRHPNYLRIGGRPVLIIYLTRTFAGKYKEAIKMMRSEMASLGIDPFLIADEVFWSVIEENNNEEQLRQTNKPQLNRIKLFDAITAYNMYDWSNSSHSGYGEKSAFLQDVRELFKKYSERIPQRTGFVPNLMPGYNDRGVRLILDHYAIPRQLREDNSESYFFEKSFHETVLPFIDPDLNIVLITSWNEWNEDTSIEPLRQAAYTSKDRSRSGKSFTQGFSYGGYGMVYLELLRDMFVAVSGRVEDKTGKGISGVKVNAWRNNQVAATDITDSSGYYTLSRLKMAEGSYVVGLQDKEYNRKVTVGEKGCSKRINFKLSE